MNKVAIVSPEEIWATGLVALIQRFGFEAIGHWTDPLAALKALTREPPLIIVLSPRFASDFALGRANLQSHPVVLAFEDGSDLQQGLLGQLPVKGLLNYGAEPATIEQCLRSVASGNVWIDPAICNQGASHEATLWTCLTSREQEVATLAAKGLSNKSIAKALHLSDGTVKIHMHHVYGKLHLSSRADLTEFLFRSPRHDSGKDKDIYLPLPPICIQ